MDVAAGFLPANMGAAEVRRKCGIPPAMSGNWRRRFVDAGRRELAGAGGNGRSDPAKALARRMSRPESSPAGRPWPPPS